MASARCSARSGVRQSVAAYVSGLAMVGSLICTEVAAQTGGSTAVDAAFEDAEAAAERSSELENDWQDKGRWLRSVSCRRGTLDPHEFHMRSASELARAIRQGEVTSVGLLNIYLDRIAQYNGSINAVVALAKDAAMERAIAADEALRAGEIWGPLHGVPMTIKDSLEVTGMPTTTGTRELEDYVPDANAIAVQRLINAGAIVFGKTNVPERAMDWQSFNDVYGTTNNPWDLTRTPGGSSGGAAAATAAGMTALELGSDVAGSIRAPSSFNGVFGHKPTFGLVPRVGHLPPMPGTLPPELMPALPYFVVGPLARSTSDLELALEVITNGQSKSLAGPRHRHLRDYRVAVLLSTGLMAPAEEVSTKIRELVARLRRLGTHVELEPRLTDVFRKDVEIASAMWDDDGSMIFPMPAVVAAHQEQRAAYWAEFFARYDVVLTPVTPMVAFPHDPSTPLNARTLQIDGRTENYVEANYNYMNTAIIAGLPATVAPLGLGESCLPIGVQVIGPYYGDRITIDFAKKLSVLYGGFSPPPDYE